MTSIDIGMFTELTLASIALRVALSLIVGGMLGIERGRKNASAGLRTHMLVCLGAALVMMTNQYVVQRYGGDPTRLGAQVISGIGFLGAGTILVTRRNQVRGLTTAAGLWAAACLGLAIGIGFYEGAVIVAVMTLLIMALFQKISNRINEKSRYMRAYLSFRAMRHFDGFLEFCSENDVGVSNIELTKSRGTKDSAVSVVVNLKSPRRGQWTKLMSTIGDLDGLNYIEEL